MCSLSKPFANQHRIQVKDLQVILQQSVHIIRKSIFKKSIYINQHQGNYESDLTSSFSFSSLPSMFWSKIFRDAIVALLLFPHKNKISPMLLTKALQVSINVFQNILV